MALTRRQFLRSSGLGLAYASLPFWLSACAREAVAPAGGVLAATETIATTPAPDSIVHLLNRITYGPRPGDVERVTALGWDAFLNQQLHPEQVDDGALERRLSGFSSLTMSNAELIAAYPPAGKKSDKPGPVAAIRELQDATLLRAIYSERQLFEIMVDFWSNHFNIFIGKNQIKWLKTSDDRDVIRRHALGKFSDLLLASAKSPAMLVYLDNARNRANLPAARLKSGEIGVNENYAREVMELHTVGADGGYTQDDVITAARALSGWGVRPNDSDDPGSFVFRAPQHDSGPKQIAFLSWNVAGDGGMAEGEELLTRLALHPKTAERIAYKLAAAFVSDDPPEALVARAAQTYSSSGSDIRATLAVILHSNEFKAAAGEKIKLPLRMLVSAIRALDAEVGNPQPIGRQLQRLGQGFFEWQSPNGYPQAGAAWVNTGGMLARWNTAFALAEGRINRTTYDQAALIPGDNLTAGALVDHVSQALLHIPLPDPARAALVAYVSDGQGADKRLDARTRARTLPELVGLVLASPGFQLH